MRLPKAIMPIVERLREHVEKPEDPPVAYRYKHPFDESRPYARWIRGGCACCPMGLLPGADSCPGDAMAIPGDYKDEDVEAFADFWDNLTVEQACVAVEKIWNR